MAWKLKQDSFHVMRVKFIDGNKRTFYSIDWRHEFSKYRHPDIGLNRLRGQLYEWGGLIETASIYINDGKKNGCPIEKYENGIKIHETL